MRVGDRGAGLEFKPIRGKERRRGKRRKHAEEQKS
jgi:hypothetical protein